MTTNVGNTSNRKRSTSILLVIAIALTTVVAVGVGAEFYVRHRVTTCLSETLQGELGGPVDVGLGAKPLLLTALDNKVSTLSVDSGNASFTAEAGGAKLQGFALQSEFRDITLPASDGTGGTIGSSEATIEWPTASILASLQTLPFGAVVTGVQTDDAANTITVQLLGGIGSITLTPTAANGAITLTSTAATALGIGLPNDAVQQIIDLIASNLDEYPLGLAPQSVKVENGGLTVQLRGGHAELPNDSAAKVDCSIF